MATKPQYTLRLSSELWAQVDDLKGYFGDDRPEILTHILRDWFLKNRHAIEEQKEAINRLGNVD